MKQHYCFFRKFNNYFNRKIIYYDNFESYLESLEDVDDYYIPMASDEETPLPFDFNPNDNVMTEIVVNSVPFDPDYFILFNDDYTIASRWFVLEQKRNRQGQWVYTLRRDVIADHLEELKDSPIFVQKGMLPEDDPMICNSEGMLLNQVKVGETLLKDNSKSAWVVCYLAKNLASANIPISIKPEEETTEYFTLAQIATEIGITESKLIDLISFESSSVKTTFLTNEFTLSYNSYVGAMDYRQGVIVTSADLSQIISTRWTRGSNTPENLFVGYVLATLSEEIQNNAQSLQNEMPNIIGRDYYLDYDKVYKVLSKYDGKTILYANKYYKFSVNSLGTSSSDLTEFKPAENLVWNSVCEQAVSGDAQLGYNRNGYARYSLKETRVSISLQFIEELNKTVNVSISSSRLTCENQEFDIVFIPASDIKIQIGTAQFLNIDGRLAQKFASALALKESTNIYDIQLLPYCPRPDLINSDGYIDITNLTENTDYNAMTSTDGTDTFYHGYVFYASSASFSVQLNYQLTMQESAKIESQTDFYRIISPNYQGSFEFNLAKNGGTVGFFTAYCTYRPYTPFIKVTPELKWLYGADYNDDRGLICGGDFSLPRATSAWEQYQLENKNYQNIFNREIQHLDFMQSIEMRNQYVSGAVGILGDTVKGASAGAYVGGGWGALAGGLAGMTLSASGYAIDVDTMARTHRENKQLAIDKFNYQLGNIQALPYTLTKIGSFDISSKIFPVLVHYACTEQEKEALKNKIKYESMTVMRIGTLREFMNFNNELNYFKGELIRNETIADDPHTFNAIYEEFLKGVYI